MTPKETRLRLRDALTAPLPARRHLSWWLDYLNETAYGWLHLQRGAGTGRLDTDAVYVHVQLLRVPPDRQRQGYGTAIMWGLCEVADCLGWTLTVSPSTDFGASSVARLERFYKRFGFRLNRGRRRDLFANARMVRPPAA